MINDSLSDRRSSVEFSQFHVHSEADIEKCKQKDMLEQLLAEMAGTFPSITTVFVDERDIFLAHTLKRSSNMRPEAGKGIAIHNTGIVNMCPCVRRISVVFSRG